MLPSGDTFRIVFSVVPEGHAAKYWTPLYTWVNYRILLYSRLRAKVMSLYL